VSKINFSTVAFYVRVNSEKLVGFVPLWSLQERQMQEALVCLKTRLLVHFQPPSGQSDPVCQRQHLHGLCKMRAAWHHCLEPCLVSWEKSSLAYAGTADLLRLCLWHQQFDLRQGCWRFWVELTGGSSNTEAAEGSRLPWGTNHLWPLLSPVPEP